MGRADLDRYFVSVDHFLEISDSGMVTAEIYVFDDCAPAQLRVAQFVRLAQNYLNELELLFQELGLR